jgi:hypothetical protein
MLAVERCRRVLVATFACAPVNAIDAALLARTTSLLNRLIESASLRHPR